MKKTKTELPFIQMVTKENSTVLYQENGEMHTEETLAKFLDQDLVTWKIIERELIKKGILCYCITWKNGFEQKIYLLNPTLLGRSASFFFE